MSILSLAQCVKVLQQTYMTVSIDSWAQDCGISSASAMELPQFCTKQSQGNSCISQKEYKVIYLSLFLIYFTYNLP